MPQLTPADLDFLALAFLCYLLGSIPPAYVAARTFGVDLRRRGSGNVGGANVWVSVRRWLVVPVGMLEVAKGAGSVLLAAAAGFDEGGQMLAGVAALTGHNWSLFIGFSGGRGTGVVLGVLLLLAPLQLGLFAGSALLGLVLGLTPLGVLGGLLLIPFSALVSGQHISVFLGCLAILAVVAVKRLGGSGGWESGADWREVAFLRLFFDRDVRRREDWVARPPRD